MRRDRQVGLASDVVLHRRKEGVVEGGEENRRFYGLPTKIFLHFYLPFSSLRVCVCFTSFTNPFSFLDLSSFFRLTQMNSVRFGAMDARPNKPMEDMDSTLVVKVEKADGESNRVKINPGRQMDAGVPPKGDSPFVLFRLNSFRCVPFRFVLFPFDIDSRYEECSRSCMCSNAIRASPLSCDEAYYASGHGFALQLELEMKESVIWYYTQHV